MMVWMMLCQLAFGDAMQNVLLASDNNTSVEEREAAFAEVVRDGATEIQYLLDISVDVKQSTRVRWVAIRALGEIRGPQAQEVLMVTLRDPQPAIRTATVSALGDLGNGQNVALVGRFLEDDAVIVRVAAAESLGKLKDPKSIPLLERALKDPKNEYRGASLWVRAHYVMALGEIGDSSAYPILLQCLSDGDTRVVENTIPALEKIAGFSLGDGRSSAQEVEAWMIWVQNQLR